MTYRDPAKNYDLFSALRSIRERVDDKRGVLRLSKAIDRESFCALKEEVAGYNTIGAPLNLAGSTSLRNRLRGVEVILRGFKAKTFLRSRVECVLHALNLIFCEVVALFGEVLPNESISIFI